MRLHQPKEYVIMLLVALLAYYFSIQTMSSQERAQDQSHSLFSAAIRLKDIIKSKPQKSEENLSTTFLLNMF